MLQVERRAVIDVGTNSVKLLVAEVARREVRPLLETSEQTRLGQGLHQTRRMQPQAIADTVRAVSRFAAMAADYKPASVRVVATCAAREAQNGNELLLAIENACGLSARIITGDEEAEWVFKGVCSDSRFDASRLLILDVGGGSTETILGQNQHHTFRHSFPIGSLRLLDELPPADPPSPADLSRCQDQLNRFIRRFMVPALGKTLSDQTGISTLLVGTGGTATILARMELRATTFERDALDHVRLTRGQVLNWLNHLWQMPLSERKKVVGLPPNRADVILMGVVIYHAIMEQFSFEDFFVRYSRSPLWNCVRLTSRKIV